MEMNKQRAFLAEGLAIYGATRNGMIAILGVLETPEEERKMIDWLVMQDENSLPTENEMLVKALEIHAQMKAEAETQ